MFRKINWEKFMTISTLINRSGEGNNVSTFQIIVSRARKEIVNIKIINKEFLKLQSEYEKIDKEKYNHNNRENFGYVHQPRYQFPDFISISLMSL